MRLDPGFASARRNSRERIASRKKAWLRKELAEMRKRRMWRWKPGVMWERIDGWRRPWSKLGRAEVGAAVLRNGGEGGAPGRACAFYAGRD